MPALDGVRALAVAAVLVFHARPDWLPGGFLGVDAFFVLSGYLITGLLLAEWRTAGRVRLAAFWGRRARRLLPALLLLLVAVAVVARLLLPPEELAGVRLDALAALAYVANWRMIFRGGDYFAATAPPSPLQHTWSLGIEEQFYLLWPLLVVVVLRARRHWRGLLLAVCGAGVVASGVACALLYHPDRDPGRAYYGTDTRAGALLAGCTLAILTAGRELRVPAWLALPAAGGVAYAWATADGGDGWLYRGGLTALAVGVAVVLGYLVSHPAGWGARLLSVPPLAWLGRVSYGVYLWHWPLYRWITADRTGLTGTALFGVRVAGTLAVAAVSFHLLEKPVREGLAGYPARRRDRRLLVPVTTGAMAAVALVVTAATATGAAGGGSTPAAVALPAAPATHAPATPGAVAPTARPGRRPGAQPRVTILGDSVAWTIGAYLPAHPGLTVTNRAVQGCGIARLPDIRYIGTPHTNYPGCDTWDGRWRAAVAADDPDVSMILLNRWELMDRRLNGRYQAVGDPEYDAYLTRELTLAISIAAGDGARVVLLTAAYTHRSERPDGGLYPEDTPQRVDAWNRLLATVAAAAPSHPTILDLNRLTCPNGVFTWSIGGLQVRGDGLHFTPAGVQRIIAPWLLPQLTRLATAP
jgi:peptidoglycan/LPS O-acetylase OafA/YrhL